MILKNATIAITRLIATTILLSIMFGVSEKRPSSNSKFCIYQSRMA
ncbi:hypothetical protein T08_1567 [Trichinella sp. T8]|nr:hypothetical protein T08_1567 [Trichinella sp. T8]